MKYLFIGGCRDGDWIEVEDDKLFMTPVPPRLRDVLKDVDKQSVDTYVLTAIGEYDDCRLIYVVEGTAVVPALVDNYRPKDLE